MTRTCSQRLHSFRSAEPAPRDSEPNSLAQIRLEPREGQLGSLPTPRFIERSGPEDGACPRPCPDEDQDVPTWGGRDLGALPLMTVGLRGRH